MKESIYLRYQFKHRDSAELIDGYIEIKDVSKLSGEMKKFFNIHDFKIIDKRLVRKDEYEKWRRDINFQKTYQYS